MLTFAEEIILLLLDDEKGTLTPIPSSTRDYALSGAILMDLALRERIDTDLERLIAIDCSPTGIGILDEFLLMICDAEEKSDTSNWLRRISEHGESIQDQALEMLVERKILKVVEEKLLWVFETRRYPSIDTTEEREVKRRLLDTLMSDDLPDPRDIVLICLVEACSIFDTILSRRELDFREERIAQLRRMDLIGQSVSRAIADISERIALVPFPVV